MYFKWKYLNILTFSFLLLPFVSSAVTLNCPKNFNKGAYTGHLTDIIDEDGWAHTVVVN